MTLFRTSTTTTGGSSERARSGRLRKHIRDQWAGLLALFLVLTGGTAYALNGTNTVFTDDIVNGQVRAADVANDTTPYALTGLDIKNDSMGGHDVIDNDLKGVDIDEPTLGTVPTAAQGGTGRYAFEGGCNPESVADSWPWENCAFVPVPLARPGRVLIIGQVRTYIDVGERSELGWGACRLEVNGTPIRASETVFDWEPERELEYATLTAVSDVLPVGSPIVGIECQERTDGSNSTLNVGFARLSAVALSAN